MKIYEEVIACAGKRPPKLTDEEFEKELKEYGLKFNPPKQANRTKLTTKKPKRK
ncbi:MAG: hypothetical protein FWG64_12990 [Firmicutes bacterium]|nr:hypothetical protein [Bacillota bacterium]